MTDDLCLSGLIQSSPEQLPLSGVTLATGARTHALFDSHGTVYGCGSGDAGELGNGSTTSTSKPTPVLGLPSGVKISALTSSWEGSGALLANGEYYNWGYNAAGQLGDGSTTNSALPDKVELPAPVIEVSQGGSGANNGQTIAVLRDGSVWAWGSNDRGQLGIGGQVDSPVPVQVHVPRRVTFAWVYSGGYASYAVDCDRTTVGLGRQQEGSSASVLPRRSRRCRSTLASTSARSRPRRKTSPAWATAPDALVQNTATRLEALLMGAPSVSDA